MDMFFINKTNVYVIDSELVETDVRGYCWRKDKTRKNQYRDMPDKIYLGRAYQTFDLAYETLRAGRQADLQEAVAKLRTKQIAYDKVYNITVAKRLKS